MYFKVIIVWWYGYLLVSARSHKQEKEEEDIHLDRNVSIQFNSHLVTRHLVTELSGRDCMLVSVP